MINGFLRLAAWCGVAALCLLAGAAHAQNSARRPVWQWVSSPGTATAACTTTDAAGDLYVGGAFTGTVTFGRTTLTSRGDADGFVAKYHHDTCQ